MSPDVATIKRANFDLRFSRQFARARARTIGILVPFLLEALDEGRAISPAARKPRNGIVGAACIFSPVPSPSRRLFVPV